MADRIVATGGRRPPDRPIRQILTSMDPDITRWAKAALRDKMVSFVLEEAAKEWLARNETPSQGKKG